MWQSHHLNKQNGINKQAREKKSKTARERIKRERNSADIENEAGQIVIDERAVQMTLGVHSIPLFHDHKHIKFCHGIAIAVVAVVAAASCFDISIFISHANYYSNRQFPR